MGVRAEPGGARISWSADAGSWQIAGGYTMASSAARRVAVRDFRVRFVVEPQLVPQLLYALLETGADMVVHYQGVRARPALGACAAAPEHPVDMLTDERPYSRLPDAAAMQLCGCATPL